MKKGTLNWCLKVVSTCMTEWRIEYYRQSGY